MLYQNSFVLYWCMLPDHFVVYNMVYMVYNNIVLYDIVLYGVQTDLYNGTHYQSDNLCTHTLCKYDVNVIFCCIYICGIIFTTQTQSIQHHSFNHCNQIERYFMWNPHLSLWNNFNNYIFLRYWNNNIPAENQHLMCMCLHVESNTESVQVL